jgi:hypothetical protein
VREAYGSNCDRLVKLKSKFDAHICASVAWLRAVPTASISKHSYHLEHRTLRAHTLKSTIRP